MRKIVLPLAVAAIGVAAAVAWTLFQPREESASEDLLRMEADLLAGDVERVVDRGRDPFEDVEAAERSEVRPPGEVDLTITLPGRIPPPEREARYADPLAEALGALGEVTGGGMRLETVDGKVIMQAADIEVTVFDIEKALPIVRESLKRSGAPKATTITRHQPRDSVQPLWKD